MIAESMKSLEFNGKWFFPDKPAERFNAHLYFDVANGARLEPIDNQLLQILMERFGKKDLRKGTTEFAVTSTPISVPIILGEGAGKAVTLYDCAIVGFSIRASIIILGTHSYEISDLKFVKLRVRYSGIDSWGASGGFTLTLPDDPSVTPTHAEYIPSPPIEAMIPTGKLRVDRFISFTLSVSREALGLAEKTWIEFSNTSPLLLDDCLGSWVWAFRNFLMLATNQVVTPTEVIGFRTFDETEESIEIYYSDRGERANIDFSTTSSKDPIFFLGQIAPEFERTIRAWFEKLETIRPLVDLYFGLMYVPRNYAETEFLTLAQALEAFHGKRYGGEFMSDEDYRRIYESMVDAIPKELDAIFKQRLCSTLQYANKYSLRQRVKELLAELAKQYGELIDKVVGKRSTFVNRVTKMRNELTHETKLSKGLNDPRLLNLTVDQLKCITLLCLFAEVELSPETVSTIIQYNILFNNTIAEAKSSRKK